MTALESDLAARLCAAGRQAVACGLSPGASGNVSVRDGERLLLSPTGVSLGDLRPGALACTDLAGRVVDAADHAEPPAAPDHAEPPTADALEAAEALAAATTPRRLARTFPAARPTKEVPLHVELYRRFPQARAVVHVHSPHAVAVSCRRPWSTVSALAPLTPYLVMRVGRVPLAPYAAPGTAGLAASLDAVDGPFRAALLARHGSIAWGPTIEDALDAVVEVEEAARIALLAGPDAEPLTAAQIAELTTRYGAPWSPR